MFISVDWIKDFVNLPDGLGDRELSERITLGVCEVEGYERTAAMLSKVSVAAITSVAPHPDADKLHLASVDLGNGDEATVVCGAPNCRVGIKVPYATLGTSFPGGFTLEPKKIRGVVSEGMLCSEEELGISDNHDGLMELSSDAPVGVSLAEALGEGAVDDLVLDIDNKSLTHRPDLWGHYGMAREFAAVFQLPYKDKFDGGWAEKLKAKIDEDAGGTDSGQTPPVTIHVDKDSANRGFLGLSVDGITIGESPEWMQRRLNVAGMRPINSIVDISNYAMLETGIPNHIFDRSTVAGGKIIVRRAGEDLTFVTLDEQERKLVSSDTMVCDGEKPSAIAGIMGGLTSSVADDTSSIMIEVANWADAQIRRTSTRLGLRTDASQRYEKSLDSQQLEKALLRIFELILELNPGAKAVGGIQSDNMPEPLQLAIETSPMRITRVLGEYVSDERLTGILEALGFTVEEIPGAEAGSDGKGKTHLVYVPTWRSTKDVECEADIVEEIGRIIGYDNITPVSPAHDIAALRLSPAKKMIRKAQDYLVLRGHALEILTYPMVGKALLAKASWPVLNEGLVLANALSPDHDRMRPSLIPSLLEAAANNRKEHDSFRLFEIGRSYADLGGDKYSQDLHQIGVVFQEERTNPFIELVDIMEGLCSYLGLSYRMVPARSSSLIPEDWAGSHPHEIMEFQVMGRSRGVVLSVHPQVSRGFKIKGRTAVAVLDITELMALPLKDKTAFKPLDRFPGSVFDLTVVTPEKTYASTVLGVVRGMKMKEIRSVSVLDVFDLGDNGKALTLHVEFRDLEKTLDASFIKEAENKIIAVLDKAGFSLRS